MPTAVQKTSDFIPASLLIHTLAQQSRRHTHLSDMLLHNQGAREARLTFYRGWREKETAKRKEERHKYKRWSGHTGRAKMSTEEVNKRAIWRLWGQERSRACTAGNAFKKLKEQSAAQRQRGSSCIPTLINNWIKAEKCKIKKHCCTPVNLATRSSCRNKSISLLTQSIQQMKKRQTRRNLSNLQPSVRAVLGVRKSAVGSWQHSVFAHTDIPPAVTYKGCTKALSKAVSCSSFVFIITLCAWDSLSCRHGLYYTYLVGPGVLVPGRKLQHSDDFIDLCAHLLKSEVTVLQGLLHTVAARCLGCHKDLDSWRTK